MNRWKFTVPPFQTQPVLLREDSEFPGGCHRATDYSHKIWLLRVTREENREQSHVLWGVYPNRSLMCPAVATRSPLLQRSD